MGNQGFREQDNDRRVGVLLVVGLIALLGGLYVAGHYFTGDKVPTGTTIAGVQVGGLTPADAERTLTRALRPRIAAPITLSADGERVNIVPRKTGLGIDAAKSVAQAAGGGRWNPVRIWNYYTGGDDHDVIITVDDARLGAATARLSKKFDRPATEGKVSIEDGRAEPTFAQPGQAIDQEATADEVTAAFLHDTEVVPIPVGEVEPEITTAEVHAAMDEFANPAMSAPVVIEIDNESVALRPEAYSSAISLASRDGGLVPVLDDRALLRGIRPAMRSVTRAPKEATVELVGGTPKVVPGRTGLTFEPADITSEFLSLVVQKGARRTLEVDRVEDEPEFTTTDARRLQITRPVSSFTTYYPHADYRNSNLGRAAELVNGAVLKPGETFSLNDTVGERTAANGFVEGFIISDGIYEEDFGGGVSQVATTLFNAAFFAGLEDVEHKPHSFYIDRYPLGREATVAWGSVDLRFKNDTPYGVLIEASIDRSTPTSEGVMNVTMWSTKHWDVKAGVSERYDFTTADTRTIDDDECTPNDGYGGFEVDVYRYFRRPDSPKLVRKETMHTTYTPSDSVICE